MWLDEVEPSAMQQAENLANLPFVFKHIALMPDCHSGYGMPIGGVIAARNVIVPNAVGVDIGCGMCAVQLSLHEIKKESLKKIMNEIRQQVPLGFKHHKEKQNENLMPDTKNLPEKGIVKREYDSALYQIGTLGGGNHFIEIQKGNDGHIWLMIHSGSRNLGLKVAEYYHKTAKSFIMKNKPDYNVPSDLAFLPFETEEAQAYWQEMNYCVEFALANRKHMMDTVTQAVQKHVKKKIETLQFINIAHNYAQHETHFGENVIVHRKGATSARNGELGIIPGSQGTKSYIVRGKGNPMSFQSCSHGAGRIMGRKQAQRELSLEDEISKLESKGIIHSVRTVKDLDEAPGAYKLIDEVMQNQNDLVEIVTELVPLAVIKG